MLTPKQYNSYFRNLASNHVNIDNYQRIIMNTPEGFEKSFYLAELESKIRSTKGITLVSIMFTGAFNDNTSSNYLQDTRGAFLIVEQKANTGDVDAIDDIYERTYDIALQCIAYMKEDVKKNQIAEQDIQFRDVDFDFFGPYKGIYHGIMVNFKYNINVNRRLNYKIGNQAQFWNNPL